MLPCATATSCGDLRKQAKHEDNRGSFAYEKVGVLLFYSTLGAWVEGDKPDTSQTHTQIYLPAVHLLRGASADSSYSSIRILYFVHHTTWYQYLVYIRVPFRGAAAVRNCFRFR